MTAYSPVQPEIVVSTDWVVQHLHDSTIRLIEVGSDAPTDHIPGAVFVDGYKDFDHSVKRDLVDKVTFEALLSRLGITPETTVVFYGHRQSYWATYGFWVFQLFGHEHSRILNGGKEKWVQEGHPLSDQISDYPTSEYAVTQHNHELVRIQRGQVLDHIRTGKPILDVRTLDEFHGLKHDGALRGGHIPGAKHVPWDSVLQSDYTFKSQDELRKLYVDYDPDEEIFSYCGVGVRSSHTWFTLKYLLGFERARNYDGSWREWGNLVNVPIER